MAITHVQASVVYLVASVAVLVLAREPVRHPDKPGSRGFLISVLSISLWLLSAGLSSFVPSLGGTLVLYNVMLFSVLGVFLGYIVLAVEYATQRLVSRRFLLAVGGVATAHFLLLWTNFFGLHEIMYGADTYVDDYILVPDRGPGFWAHTFIIQSLIALSIALFTRETVISSGLRRRQAIVLLSAPLPGLVTNGYWLFGDHGLTWDPTPLGVMAGVLILGWALYRTGFLEIVPVARATVIEEMTDAIVTLDDESRLLDWNATARERLGIDEPTVGMDASAFFEAVPDETLAELTTTDDEERAVDVEIDGRTVYFSVLVSRIDVGAPEDGRVLVFRDVTAERERERQLAQQNETLESFANAVSSDLREPLGDIRRTAAHATDTGDVSGADDVIEAADTLERQVGDLLELVRAGQRIEERETVEFGAVAEEAWRSVWSVDAELSVHSSGTFRADRGRLQRLLEILFQNSVEHGGNDAHVSVGIHSKGFYVDDDGSGVPSENRHRVFERGFSTSSNASGLGLAVVRQIVGAHGWRIHVDESDVGGARFEIRGVDVASRATTSNPEPGGHAVEHDVET